MRPFRPQKAFFLLSLFLALGLVCGGKFAWSEEGHLVPPGRDARCLEKIDGGLICVRDTVISKEKGTIGSVVQLSPAGSALVRMLQEPSNGGQGLLLEFSIDDLEALEPPVNFNPYQW